VKRKIFSILFALVLVLSFSLITAVPAMAQTTWYVATTGSDTTGDGTSGNPWATIQHAVNTVAADDTINVAAGTYNENVVIDKTLTLMASSSPVIDAGGTPTTPNVIGIAIAANNVTVDGFTVTNARGSNSGGIYIGGTFVGETRNLRGVTVKYCTVHDSNFGIYPWGTGSGNANVVDHNTVYDIYDDMSGGGGVGIVLWDEGVSAVGNSDNEVTNNTVYNCDRQGIFLGSGEDVPNDNNEISGNIVHDNGLNTGGDGHGIQLFYAAKNTISNNEIYNHTAATSWFQAGVMLNYSNDNAISGNNIYDNKIGVALYTNTGVTTIHFNCITGNTRYGVGNWDAIWADAENNWWGDASGPYCPWGNPDGKGDEVSHYVDYAPWITGLAYTGAPQPTTSVELEATVSDSASGGASGVTVDFYVDGGHVGDATTDGDGVARLDIVSKDVGVYTVRAVAVGGCLEAKALLAVYDPSAGFVTGGGWIDSPSGAYSPTYLYQDQTLSDWHNGNFAETFDLTKGDLTLSYTIDMSGQQSGGWTPIQVGLREVSQGNLDPNGSGGWMQQNWQNPATDPNDADIDDHFLLVDHGWSSDELDYDVDPAGNIITPFGIYLGHAFWFDRDGVDSDQATYWNYKDGITYNTGGIYDVEITYQYDSVSGKGTMFATINGEQQGFYLSGYDSANPPDTQPVGKSFAGDMTQMQVFFGRGGGGGTVELSNIEVIHLLIGKATFGFVSKYKKGADTPIGQTEFMFKAGDLNFHSTSYDWLVVTGSDYARFKGSGTINGMGDYKFMLWAGDDDPDTFRIKIWYEVNDEEYVVYDNGMDQSIGGGSIVVHKVKK
jgi:nitrous oxidase accessory protein NosD